ncbi:hypothetical protein JZ751_013081 [Albula glossodonta]|uniref:Phosphatidylcholine transfer protein n=1 Tax=Albula glossodonta TaxID=121402 RepID=A0A8T2NRZ9_9TELE|nr:hypothetical protein JZ751_013081 [Albula glossodonta]
MSLCFTDEQFQEAWKELDEPQLEGWEFFTETMGVKIYRLYDKETGLYEYKVFGTLSTCGPELCADVYMDLAYRKKWDGYVKELCEKEYDGQTAIYWEVKYPFPLSNRDIWVVLAQSHTVSQCPEKSGVLRVKDYKQSLAIECDGSSGTKMFMNYFDNPGGMIPTWLVNWAAKSGVPGFLTDMQKACKNYPEYCSKCKK